MDVTERSGARERLREVRNRLEPDTARAEAIADLDEMFGSGSAPDPLPEGMLEGSLVTTSVWGPLDSLARRIAKVWMPWLGKSFDPVSMSGVNVLTKSARGPMRVLWPGYVPERELADRIEAFPFRVRIAPGEVDPDLDVLKIDYDFGANPDLLIRRILDELVQVDDGLYLGKILFRRRGSWLPIGFFTLER
jgi:hypothetical protein